MIDSWQHTFRQRTEERCAEVPGIQFYRFVCQRCRQSRSVSGRKQAVKGSNKHGYICAECAK